MLPFEQTKVRLYGDEALAQGYIGAARRLLFQVKQIVQTSGVPVYALTQEIEGGFIQASYHGGLTAVTVDVRGVSGGDSSEKEKIKEIPMGLLVQTSPNGFRNGEEGAELLDTWLITPRGKLWQGFPGRLNRQNTEPGRWYASIAMDNAAATVGYAHGPNVPIETREMWGGLCRPDGEYQQGVKQGWIAYTAEGESRYVETEWPNHSDTAVFPNTAVIKVREAIDVEESTDISVYIPSASDRYTNYVQGWIQILDVAPHGRSAILIAVRELYPRGGEFIGRPQLIHRAIYELRFDEKLATAEVVFLYAGGKDTGFSGSGELGYIRQSEVTEDLSTRKYLAYIASTTYSGSRTLPDGCVESWNSAETATVVYDQKHKLESADEYTAWKQSLPKGADVCVFCGDELKEIRSKSEVIGAFYVEDENGLRVEPVFLDTVEQFTQTSPIDNGNWPDVLGGWSATNTFSVRQLYSEEQQSCWLIGADATTSVTQTHPGFTLNCYAVVWLEATYTLRHGDHSMAFEVYTVTPERIDYEVKRPYNQSTGGGEWTEDVPGSYRIGNAWYKVTGNYLTSDPVPTPRATQSNQSGTAAYRGAVTMDGIPIGTNETGMSKADYSLYIGPGTPSGLGIGEIANIANKGLAEPQIRMGDPIKLDRTVGFANYYSMEYIGDQIAELIYRPEFYWDSHVQGSVNVCRGAGGKAYWFQAFATETPWTDLAVVPRTRYQLSPILGPDGVVGESVTLPTRPDMMVGYINWYDTNTYPAGWRHPFMLRECCSVNPITGQIVANTPYPTSWIGRYSKDNPVPLLERDKALQEGKWKIPLGNALFRTETELPVGPRFRVELDEQTNTYLLIEATP